MTKTGIRLMLALVALICFLAARHDLWDLTNLRQNQDDLAVYYTAGTMVRTHLGQQIYNGADTGVDPQLRWAEPQTLFAKEAASLGIPKIQLYVYPPTLADMIVPLTFLPIPSAAVAWKVVNAVVLLGLAWMLVDLLGLPLWSVAGLAITACAFIFRPSLDCFFYGQITIVLGAFEVAGLLLYSRGHKTLAGLFFSVPVAVKLTPIIVVVPLLAWRDWKALRAIAFWCVALAGSVWLINGTGLILVYVQHVLPSMSQGVVHLINKNLGSAVQIMWRASHHGVSPAVLRPITKAVSLVILCYAGWLSQSQRNDPQKSGQIASLSVFLLLSACIAPVSWRHAYVFAIPALVIIAREALDLRVRIGQFLVLLAFILSISSYGFNTMAQKSGKAIFYDLAVLTPLLGIALVLLELRRLTATRSVSHAQNAQAISA